MKFAFRTDIDAIDKLSMIVKDEEITAIKTKASIFKQKIRPLLIPKDKIIKGDTLQDSYFPSTQFDGTGYDVFISHSHNNEKQAILLSAYLEYHRGLSCFVDSFAWASADQLLKEIDDRYCYLKHKKTYNYRKRNFTTSHVHAMLSMALLETIQRSIYCIFIESQESVSYSSTLQKKTLSPWLYEEIKYMNIFQPQESVKMFSESIQDRRSDFRCVYNANDTNRFPFLDEQGLLSFSKRVITRIF